MLVLFKLTLDGAVLTVTLQDAVLPLEVFTLTVAEPHFFAVIFPFASTIATVLLSLLQVKLSWEFSGNRVAVRLIVSFKPRITSFLSSITCWGTVTVSSTNLILLSFA